MVDSGCRRLYKHTAASGTPLSMNAPTLPDILLGATDPNEPELPLVAEGVQRYVWESAFGAMLIEVHDGAAFVNGQRVEPIAETIRRA